MYVMYDVCSSVEDIFEESENSDYNRARQSIPLHRWQLPITSASHCQQAQAKLSIAQSACVLSTATNLAGVTECTVNTVDLSPSN